MTKVPLFRPEMTRAWLMRAGEAIWQSSRYTLAIVTTVVVVSIVPVVVTITVGIAGFILGIVLTALSFFAESPMLGFMLGITMAAASAVGMIVALVAIVVLALVLAGAVITPAAFVIRFTLGYLDIRSRPLVAAAFAGAGVVIGLGIGLATQLLTMWAKWGIGQNLWAILGFYIAGIIVGTTSAMIYGLVLIAADVIRTGVSRVVATLNARIRIDTYRG